MAWDLSCPDWQDRIKQGRSLVPDLPLIRSEADRSVSIFNKLRLPDVPGQPRMEEAAGDWQRDIVAALFGSWDPDTNTRHIQEIFNLVPKKSSKTTGGAGIMMTALLMNRRPWAEFLLIAPTIEIAALAFRQAVGMIDADETLRKLFHVQDHLRQINFRPNKAFLKIKSFDPKVVTGSKPSGVLIDEIHVISETHDADRVMGQLRGGILPNPEAFLVMITTQSERPPQGVFKAELSKARKVRDGQLKVPCLPILYEFPDGVDWRDTKNWWMVTPNRGKSVTIERLITDQATAVEAGEEEFRRWASQHLNVEIGIALRSDGWPGAALWDFGSDSQITLEYIIANCEVVAVGVDGGGANDLFGIAVIGREKGTRRWLAWCKAMVTPLGIERKKANKPKYDDFIRDGDLILIDGLPEDLEWMVTIVEQIKDAELLCAVGVDPACTGTIVDSLATIGVSQQEKNLIGIAQGIRLMGPIKTVERRLEDGTFVHADQPLMSWCASNAKVELTATAMRITRDASGYGKIDPLMALFNAAAIMETNPVPISAASVYESQDLVVF